MKECCQWWSAMRAASCEHKRLRYASEQATDEWQAAALRMLRQHKKRVRYKPRTAKRKTCTTWTLALRTVWTQHLKRCESANNPWLQRLTAIAAWGGAKPTKTTLTKVTKCNKCRVRPKWISRLIAQHRAGCMRAKMGEWDRKMASIASGVRVRAKSRQRKAKTIVITDWQGGLENAIRLNKARRNWREANQWTRWAISGGSNNYKRARRRTDRESNKQNTTSSSGTTGQAMCLDGMATDTADRIS